MWETVKKYLIDLWEWIKDWFVGGSVISRVVRHVVVAFLIFLLITILSKDVWSGWVAQFLFFVGRERKQYENDTQLPVGSWLEGWNVFKWSKDSLLNFGIPAIVILVLATMNTIY